MFIDKARIFVFGGRGGNGCLSFRREKFIPRGGPNGGSGGKGGDVYFVADNHLRTLLDLSVNPHCQGQNGQPGEGYDRHGRSGKDVFVKVPLGTVVKVGEKVLADLVTPGEKVLVARGGRGGRGNAAFKTSRNNAPRIAEKGEPGEQVTVDLELKVIADVGLIGLPNAGKSTLLSRLTKAHPKIAAYPFTTLSPNLGMASYKDFYFAIADLPGLIEGAHEGRGLGHEFLRHVERTKILVHLVDASGFDGVKPEKNMEVVRKELKAYSPVLAKKPQVLVLTKKDVVASPAGVLSRFKKKCRGPVLMISAVTGDGIDALLKTIVKTIQSLPPEPPPTQAPYHLVLEPDFRVWREEGIFVVTGKKVERLAAMTNFGQPEAVSRFHGILKKMGLDRALNNLGAQLGDTIRMGIQEFTYDPEAKHSQPWQKR
jgi:GTP-binding protein